MPYANTQAMECHLKEISHYSSKGRHGVVIVDRAAWHTTPKINVPENLSLLPLPPTAPELNPVEQVWSWLRQHHLSNRVYKGYEDIVNECCKAWNDLACQPELIRSIGTRKWASL